MLENDRLTARETANGITFLYSLRRLHGVGSDELALFARALLRFADSEIVEIRHQARGTLATVLSQVELGARPEFDLSTLELFRRAMGEGE